MDGVTAIANILRMEGVEFIGCVPYQPLLEAAAIAGIRPMIFRQEVTGVHMVDGYSRATNGKKIGVFMMQNGPGAENGFGGVAQAYSESVPILVLPAGYHRAQMSYYPNYNSVLNTRHVTKSAEAVVLPETLQAVMRRAYFQLRNGRPGPVLVEIPWDVFGAEVPSDWRYRPSFATRSAPDPADELPD